LRKKWSEKTFSAIRRPPFAVAFFCAHNPFSPSPVSAQHRPMTTVHTSSIQSLPLLARGKVRDNYAVGEDRILMVASDRLSAFDVIMGEPIPGKGEILTQMALWWFDRLGQLCPNHLTGEAPESVVTAEEVPQVTGRSMLVKRLTPIPVEAVVRGYLAGSGWKEYQESRSVCGVPLPEGLTNASKLPRPIFTPAAKAAAGEHDENISYDRVVEIVGPKLAQQIRETSLEIYETAAQIALTKGMIIADTKFEFGLDEAGTLVLMDEVLTPDSSRYWPVEGYQAALAAGANPPSYDKQFVRDWLEATKINGKPWDKTPPAPRLPAEVIEKTAAKYREALERLTG
jgi:phosphoribosylaminoimidazole-succinocarboxamide synthase